MNMKKKDEFCARIRQARFGLEVVAEPRLLGIRNCRNCRNCRARPKRGRSRRPRRTRREDLRQTYNIITSRSTY
jgi:hypothetical protein